MEASRLIPQNVLKKSPEFAIVSLEGIFASSFNLTLAIMLVVSQLIYVLSRVHRNCSWVDRSWSIMPVAYTWIHMYYKVQESSSFFGTKIHACLNNAVVMYASLITLWGIRQTYNCARREGYARGSEDHRWKYIRSLPVMKNPIIWHLVSYLYIAVFHSAVLWGITLPLLNIPTVPIGGMDVIIGLSIFVLILFEAICDEQQQRFQRSKRALSSRQRKELNGSLHDKELSLGFCVTGIFGYSRHLNVFCEGVIWLAFAFAAILHGQFVWWQWFGCIAVNIFTVVGTFYITEKLLCKKYPHYVVYQTTTPMLFPSVTSSTARTLFLVQKQQQQQQKPHRSH